MARTEYETVLTLVRKHVNALLTDDDRTLINAMDWDLWHGPFPEGDPLDETPGTYAYPGWDKAYDMLQEVIDRLPSVLYVDVDCEYVGDDEPEGWEDPEGAEDADGNPIPAWVEPELYYTVERRDILRAVLGKELASNL